MSRTKTRQKPRTSSSDQTQGDDSDFIVAIQESLAEIKDFMVKKSDIKDIVGEIITDLKHDLKEEIISEIKNDLKVSITAQVQTEFETKIEKQYKDFDFKTKELADGFNLDFDTLREKIACASTRHQIFTRQVKRLPSYIPICSFACKSESTIFSKE